MRRRPFAAGIGHIDPAGLDGRRRTEQRPPYGLLLYSIGDCFRRQTPTAGLTCKRLLGSRQS